MNTDPRKATPLAGLTLLLALAMGMPMMIFYAIGILGPYLIEDLSITSEQLGWLTTSTFGLAAVLSPYAGTVLPRMGARTGLISLFLLMGMSFTLIALLPGFWGVIAALTLCGVAQSLANPATNLVIAQAVPASRKTVVVGFKQSGVQASALLAGFALPPLALGWGWRTSLIVWAPVILLMAVLVARFIPAAPVPAQGRTLRIHMPNALLLMLMMIQLCAGLILSSFMTFLGVYAHHLGFAGTAIGAMVSCFGVMGILSRILLTPVGNNLMDETVLLGVLFLLASLALIMVWQASAQSHWPLWIGVISMGLTIVATNAIAMSVLLHDERFGSAAASSGMLSAGFFSGFAIGPPSIGWLLTTTATFSVVWLGLIGVSIAGSVLCFILKCLRGHGGR